MRKRHRVAPLGAIRLSAAALLAPDSSALDRDPRIQGLTFAKMSQIVEQDELGLDLGIRDADQTDTEVRIPAAFRR